MSSKFPERLQFLKSDNDKVLRFTDSVVQDLNAIGNKISDDVRHALGDRRIITQSNLLEALEFISYDSYGCVLLKELIPVERLVIQTNLDSRRFKISIRGFYGYLLEVLLSTYLQKGKGVKELAVKKLNQFIACYNARNIPYKIILPIKGIRACVSSSNDLVKKFLSEKSGLVLYRNILLLSRTQDIFFHNEFHMGFAKKLIGMAIYCKGNVKFKIASGDWYDFKNCDPVENYIGESEVWSEIKNIFSCFVLNNLRIGYSKQYYQFPWWIPNERIDYDFPLPNWLQYTDHYDPDESYSSKQKRKPPYSDLVPNVYCDITYLGNRRAEIMEFYDFGEISGGLGLFVMESSKQDEKLLEIPSSMYDKIIKTYYTFSRQRTPINFLSNQFLIDRLIKLRFRTNIEDTVIDACLVIESLLTGGKRRLTYQFKTHPSLLISRTPEELERNIQFFKHLYKLRSKIVHGDKEWRLVYHEFLAKFGTSNLFENYELKVVDLIFRKILQIIERINTIGTVLNKRVKTHLLNYLFINLQFIPQGVNLFEFIQSFSYPVSDAPYRKTQNSQKDLKRCKDRLIATMTMEGIPIPDWVETLKEAIIARESGKLNEVKKLLYCLDFRSIYLEFKDNLIIRSIIRKLETIKKQLSEL